MLGVYCQVMSAGKEAQLRPHLFYQAHLAGLLANSDLEQPMLKYVYIQRLLHLVYFYFIRKRDLAQGAVVLVKVRHCHQSVHSTKGMPARGQVVIRCAGSQLQAVKPLDLRCATTNWVPFRHGTLGTC